MVLKLLFWCILHLYSISSVSSESSVKSSVSYNRHNNLSDILQTIVSNHKDVDVFTISRREPDRNSTQLFQQLHQSWYDDYNVTFLSYEDSSYKYNMACYQLPDDEDEMHTGKVAQLIFLAKLERQVYDSDSERVLNEDEDVCYPKTNPKYPLWRRAIHVVIEPLSSEDDDESSVFKIGRKIVDLKPYSDILLMWAHTEHFLNNVTFMSSMGNFTYKLGLLQGVANTAIFSYCLFCSDDQVLIEEKLNCNEILLIDTSKDLHGAHYPGMAIVPNVNKKKSNCAEALEDHYEVTQLCDVSKKLNFTWTVESITQTTAMDLLGNPRIIAYLTPTNLPLVGKIGEPYRMVFTRPWQLAHFTFVHRKPRTIFYWYNFFLPFTRESWIYVFSSLIITAFLTSVITNGFNFNYNRLLKSLFPSIFILARLQLNQCPSPPVKVSGIKIISATWLFHCLIINTGYNTKLYSFLTVPMKEKNIPNTFEELQNSKYFRPGGYDVTISVLIELLTDMKMITEKDVLHNILKNKKRFVKTDFTADCLRLIKNDEDIVCIDCDIYLRRVSVQLSSAGNENFFEFGDDPKDMFFVSLGVWRENPHFPHIDHIIQQLIDSGLMYKYLYEDRDQVVQIHHRRKQIKDFYNSTTEFNFKRKLMERYRELGLRVLSLQQLRGIFLLFGCSVLLSVLCCFTENVSH